MGGITPTPVSSTDTAKMRTYIQYYSYDQVGNMQEMKHTVTGGTGNWTRDFTIDTASNKTLSTTIGSNGSGTESYTYDNRGNMSAGMNHLTSLTYNELNRLEKVIDASGNITTYYQYDATGERVRKVTSDTGSNTEKRRIYDGQWELYSHKTSGTLDLQRETLHIMDDNARIALIDTPTLNTTGSGELQNLRYQFSNHLNTATLELDYNAANISYEEYYPFGSTSFQSGRSASEISLKRYRYTAKERDEETGLYYHGARYYAPWLARWIAVDPLEGKYSPESSYDYGHNNPITWQDSTGMGPDDKNNPISIDIKPGPRSWQDKYGTKYSYNGKEVEILNGPEIKDKRAAGLHYDSSFLRNISNLSSKIPIPELHLGFTQNVKPLFDLSKNEGSSKIQEARVRAFLRMLRVGEGTSGEKGYEKLFGGASFIKDYDKDWSTHPNILIKTKKYSSSAAGAYQIMSYTYKELGGEILNKHHQVIGYQESKNQIRKYGIKDFSPASQDLLAVIILKEKDKGALDLIVRGIIKGSLDITSKEWASLPSSTGKGRYGQPTQSLNKALNNYNKFLQQELNGISNLHLQSGFLHRFGY